MSESNTYQALAEACLAAAELVRRPGERIQRLQIARKYMKLAEYVGNRSDDSTAHRPSHYDPDNHPSDS